VAPQPGDEALPTKKFYPGQVFKDSAAIFGVFAILFLLASFADAPLGALADPTDSSFVPRPEWYFLFLFEALKLFHGSLEVVAAVVLPTVAVIALAAVPFIDRGKMQRVRQRVKALAIVGVSGVAWIVLTVAAIVTTPPEAMEGGVAEVAADWSDLTPAEISGWAAYQSRKCWSCHNLTTGGPMPGPSLALLVQRKPSDWTREHFSANGASDLDAQQTSDLALFTSTVQADQAPAYEAVPPAAVAGAVVYQKYACGMCHQVADEGQTIGPPLDNVGSRRDAQWLEGHFRNPQAFVEGSTMPPYELPSDEMQSLVAYMLALE
jgi:ubiquinol-cytochrome c reductase cytochrome b subunit